MSSWSARLPSTFAAAPRALLGRSVAVGVTGGELALGPRPTPFSAATVTR